MDHALRLPVLMRDEGPLRVSDVAVRLGVARSTAHRLLQMLVHHGFAVQDEDRRYTVGPVLAGAGEPDPAEVLRVRAAPHLRLLAARSDADVAALYAPAADGAGVDVVALLRDLRRICLCGCAVNNSTPSPGSRRSGVRCTARGPRPARSRSPCRPPASAVNGSRSGRASWRRP